MLVRPEDTHFLDLMKEAKSVALLTGPAADAEAVCAMMAFYHLFKSSQTKILVVVPEAVPAFCQDLPESAAITHDLGPKNLIVSLETKNSPIAKITYLQEGTVFKLVIHPQERSFQVENIRYSYEGSRFDLFILFSVLRLTDLGDLYSKNEREFSRTPLVNFDFRPANEKYGSINFIDETSRGLSEALFKRLVSWNLVPNPAAAASLLKGLSGLLAATLPEKREVSPPDNRLVERDKFLAKGEETLIQ